MRWFLLCLMQQLFIKLLLIQLKFQIKGYCDYLFLIHKQNFLILSHSMLISKFFIKNLCELLWLQYFIRLFLIFINLKWGLRWLLQSIYHMLIIYHCSFLNVRLHYFLKWLILNLIYLISLLIMKQL